MPAGVRDDQEPGGDRQAVLRAMAPGLGLQGGCACIRTSWELTAGENGASYHHGEDGQWHLGIRCCLSPRQDVSDK